MPYKHEVAGSSPVVPTTVTDQLNLLIARRTD